jgi:NAD(P)H-dependent FMN reductase
LYEKPCAIVSAGTTGGPNSIEQIARTLAWQGAFVVETLSIATPSSTRNPAGAFIDSKTVQAFDDFVKALLRLRGIDRSHVAATSSTTLRSLGIDPVNRSGR